MDGILHRDVKKAVACRQLEIRVADDRVVSPATFSVPRVIDFWDGGVTAVLDEGYGFVRFGAEARWWMPQMLDIDAFMRYESELNRYIPTRSQSALCLYDLNHFGGDVVINAMKVHPRVVIDGLMVENPYYLDPDDYREDLATRS